MHATLAPTLQEMLALIRVRPTCLSIHAVHAVLVQETLPLIREQFAPDEVTPTARKMAKMYGLLDMGGCLGCGGGGGTGLGVSMR